MFSLAGVLILAATSWAANSIIKRWKRLNMGGGGITINAVSERKEKTEKSLDEKSRSGIFKIE